MPQLLDLPNEILLQIIAPTNVEDIESFSSCNKRIRLLFGPVLQLHMERKIKYSKTELGCSQTQTRFPHAIMLLRDVLESPAVALYPRTVVIGDCVNVSDNYWPDRVPAHRQEAILEIKDAIARCTELLSAHVDACPYIPMSDKLGWKGEICNGNEFTALAFLIMLFPNLKSITISDVRFYLGRVSDAVKNIAAAQQDLRESIHPLQKLTTVRLERSSQGFQAWFDFLEPFADLESVRHLAGRMVHGLTRDWGNWYDDDDFDEDKYESEDEDDGSDEDTNESEDVDDDGLEDDDHNGNNNEDTNESEDADDDGLEEEDHNEDNDDGGKDAQSEAEYKHKTVGSGEGITRLSFRDSAIDAASFNKVLRCTKALRTFEYNYDANSSCSDPTIWQPAAILQSLLSYASHSLISLNLTGIKGCSWNVFGGASQRYTKNPRHFQVLKRLYVQDGMLVEGKGWIGSPQSSTKPWWSITKVYQLADVLPASLEELILFPSFDHGDQITDAFRSFPELKEHRLPRLEDIKLGGGLQLDESVKLACKKVGTSVVEL